jgi:hypothetical protein
MNTLESKLRNKSRNRPGRSVEEVVLLRKFGNQDTLVSRKSTATPSMPMLDGKDPETWPILKESEIYPHHRVLQLSDSRSLHSNHSISEDIMHGGRMESALSTPRNTSVRSSEVLISNQMKDYCKYLELKVQELELKLETANDYIGKHMPSFEQGLASEQSSIYQELSSHRDSHKSTAKVKSYDKKLSTVASLIKEGYSASSTVDKSLTLRDDLKTSLGEIDIKVFGLRELFRRGNPFEIRYSAATKMVAIVRGFLARRRYQSYVQGIKAWKWSRCKMVVYVLDNWLANQTKVDIGIKRLRLLRHMRLMLSVFRKWSIVSKNHAPIRQQSRNVAEKMFKDKRKAFIRKAFNNFRDGCIGQQSQREAREQRRKLVEKIRHDLHEKRMQDGGGSSIILEEEVQRMIHKAVVTSFLEKRERNMIIRIFDSFRTTVKQSKRNEILARKHWFKQRAGKCFYSWSDYTYLVGQELQRKRWPGPRQYIVRYNQKRLDYFVRKRLLRYAFYPMREYVMKQMRGKRGYQKYITKLLKSVVAAWRTTAAKDHAVKVKALVEWTEYPKAMTSAPFLAWKQCIVAAKLRESENNSIAKGYIRWKSRQKLYTIMRTWRHQALYGRIDGLYSRQMLVKSLQEQKQHCQSLTKLLATQTMELEECRSLVQSETAKKDEIQEKLRACYLECSRLVSPYDNTSRYFTLTLLMF